MARIQCKGCEYQPSSYDTIEGYCMGCAAKRVRQHDILVGLLEAAKCPCCDGSGAYYDNCGNVCQCQWCDEVKAALAEETK